MRDRTRRTRRSVPTALLGVALALLPLAAGCGKGARAVVLGAAPADGPATGVRSLDRAGKEPVTIEGTMTEKCPVAGCWFMLKDGTGVIKVDTKGAGFAVTDVPLATSVRVTGTVAGSGERRVLAAGLRY